MRLLVLGRSGPVATELARRSGEGHEIRRLGRDEVDLSRSEAVMEAVRRALEAFRPEALINAAAPRRLALGRNVPILAVSS